MSSSRINRNIRHISSIHSQNISQELLDNCLGENITNNSETPINSLSSNSDIDGKVKHLNYFFVLTQIGFRIWIKAQWVEF